MVMIWIMRNAPTSLYSYLWVYTPQVTEHMYVCAIISIIIPNRDGHGVHENRQSKLSSKKMFLSQVMCMNN